MDQALGTYGEGDGVSRGVYYCEVSPKRPYNVKLDPELIDALRLIKEREGIAESEQIRRGIRLWLKQKKVTVQAPRPRARTRSRS